MTQSKNKIQPAEIKYLMASIQRTDSAIKTLIQFIGETTPLAREHLSRIGQELQASVDHAEALYLDERMAGRGMVSLAANNGDVNPISAPSNTPFDHEGLQRFITSTLFDVQGDDPTNLDLHRSLSEKGSVEDLYSQLRDEKVGAIQTGLYVDPEHGVRVVAVRYDNTYPGHYDRLLMVTVHDGPNGRNITAEHQVLAFSEGGWLIDAQMRYANLDRIKLKILEDLNTDLLGPALAKGQCKIQSENLQTLYERLKNLPDWAERSKELTQFNPGGLQVRFTTETPADPALDEAYEEKLSVVLDDGRLLMDRLPWEWRWEQLAKLTGEFSRVYEDALLNMDIGLEGVESGSGE